MKNKYTHITLGERAVIQTQLQEGLSPAFIAASLGRHRSTITRELARNGWRARPDEDNFLHHRIQGHQGYSDFAKNDDRTATNRQSRLRDRH